MNAKILTPNITTPPTPGRSLYITRYIPHFQMYTICNEEINTPFTTILVSLEIFMDAFLSMYLILIYFGLESKCFVFIKN